MSGDRFVIAGWGSIGRRHFSNLRTARPNAEVAILRRPGSIGHVEDGATIIRSVEAALAFSPRAAIIAAPAPSHLALASSFVRAGIPILVEKPLSHDLVGIDDLAALVREYAVPVMVGYNLRFMPSLAYLRSAVAADVIGTIHYARAEVGQYLPGWRSGSDYRDGVSARAALGGGVLLELSHELDYLIWMFGMPDRVACRGGHLSGLEIDVEDVVELCLEYDEPRRLVSVHLDFLRQPAARRCELVGSNGTLTWNAISDRIERDGKAADDAPVSATNRDDMYVAELDAFLTCVDEAKPPLITLEDGIAVMRIVDAAKRSLSSGRAVEL